MIYDSVHWSGCILNYIAGFSVFSCVYEAKNSFFGLELSYDKKAAMSL